MKTLQKILSRIDIDARDYQERLVTKTLQMYEQPFKDRFGRNRSAVDSILIESPTGSGKTVIALLVALCMQKHHGMSVGWVATVWYASMNASWQTFQFIGMILRTCAAL